MRLSSSELECMQLSRLWLIMSWLSWFPYLSSADAEIQTQDTPGNTSDNKQWMPVCRLQATMFTIYNAAVMLQWCRQCSAQPLNMQELQPGCKLPSGRCPRVVVWIVWIVGWWDSTDLCSTQSFVTRTIQCSGSLPLCQKSKGTTETLLLKMLIYMRMDSCIIWCSMWTLDNEHYCQNWNIILMTIGCSEDWPD